jgi:cytochrome c553
MQRKLKRLVSMAPASMLGLGLLCSTAYAQVEDPGRLLASNCFQCHGLKDSSPGFGKVVGRKASVLLQAMRDYQADTSGSVMSIHAKGYTDEQLIALTNWLAAYKP